MPGVYDSVSQWLQKTTSSFAELRVLPYATAHAEKCANDHLIYRLRQWPALPSEFRTADVYRTLSVMSNRPVNRRWFVGSSGLRTGQADALMRRLVSQDAVEVIDSSGFPDSGH